MGFWQYYVKIAVCFRQGKKIFKKIYALLLFFKFHEISKVNPNPSFLISFHDFITLFKTVLICLLSPFLWPVIHRMNSLFKILLFSSKARLWNYLLTLVFRSSFNSPSRPVPTPSISFDKKTYTASPNMTFASYEEEIYFCK